MARKYRNDLTAERVRELLDLRDGALYWRKGMRGLNAGHRAGCQKHRGYRAVRIDGGDYYEHRVIYLHTCGVWPSADVDHMHGTIAGNCPSNLRSATPSQNQANSGPRKNNKLGLKGVSWSKTAKKYLAQITVNREHTTLGYFDCPAAAHFAYVIAADEAWGEFARAS